MKSIVTIKRQKTSTGWKFIVSDLGNVIKVIDDVNKARGAKKAHECADQYRESVLDNSENSEKVVSFTCRCGRSCSATYMLAHGSSPVCEICAKQQQSATHTDDDEARFDDLVSMVEDG